MNDPFNIVTNQISCQLEVQPLYSRVRWYCFKRRDPHFRPTRSKKNMSIDLKPFISVNSVNFD